MLWGHGVAPGDGPEQGKELDSMMSVGSFHLSLFCDSVYY